MSVYVENQQKFENHRRQLLTGYWWKSYNAAHIHDGDKIELAVTFFPFLENSEILVRLLSNVFSTLGNEDGGHWPEIDKNNVHSSHIHYNIAITTSIPASLLMF